MNKILYIVAVYCVFAGGCRKFVEVDMPVTNLIKKTVFEEDATANAAMMNVYYLMTQPSSFSGNSMQSMTLLAGLASDELVCSASISTESYRLFFNNDLNASDNYLSSMWSSAYQIIYRVNAILESLPVSKAYLSERMLKRLEGEAKFVRAFNYFYLTNMFGKLPLVLTTNYEVSGTAPRSEVAAIYKQILLDLGDAETLLATNYQSVSFGNTMERARPNKFAVTALLARVHLYMGNWPQAEAAATTVIENETLYEPVKPENIFLKNSREAIWQLSRDNSNTSQQLIFNVNLATLRGSLVETFNAQDQRRSKWIKEETNTSGRYYVPFKYKASVGTGATAAQITEYDMVLRLGEQYLIRAEAKAQQEGKLSDAEKDLNRIRSRAGLNDTTITDRDEMLKAIENERFFELFSEWAHRWFDLKRTGRVNEVMKNVKSAYWKDTDALFPIPDIQIKNDPAMKDDQNPGYGI